MIRFGSVCSGIEAASVAWGPLGWKAEWLSEIEPFPCAVLAAPSSLGCCFCKSTNFALYYASGLATRF